MSARGRLALVGPVRPYRGGIAQYNTELRRALAPRCDLHAISFRRQYPAWLYPGKSDREPGPGELAEPQVEYTLDALNPFTCVSAARAIAARGCDLAVIHYWTLFWAPGFALMARMLRKRGVPVAFVCHNLADHDSGLIKRAVSWRLLSQADAYLVQSNAHAGALQRNFPGKPVTVHPHPTHVRFPEVTQPLPRRGRLELLFFGFIRPYKGLDTLIAALARLNDADVYLTVVGEPWCPAEQLRAEVQASGAPNVELHLDYVDDAAAARFFTRADVVVLPYRADTSSAVAAVAYHYDKPILATRVDGLSDVVEDGRTGFLVERESPEQLAACLRGLTRDRLGGMHEAVRSFKTRFTWDSLAGALLGLAQQLQAGARSDSKRGVA
jgi:glycosyltransferase involved in cell wall biosynthesis